MGTIKVVVTLEVEVDVEGWQTEYGTDEAEAVDKILRDLGEPGWYLYEPKWDGLAKVLKVRSKTGGSSKSASVAHTRTARGGNR